MTAKKQWYSEDDFSKSTWSLKFCDIWQNFYFYRIVDNENFKMEVEQMNLVTHLIFTVHYIFDYLKTYLLKFGRISFKW